jgi:hypothetical protein
MTTLATATATADEMKILKESKEKYLKSIKFISNYFVDEITYYCSLYIHTYGKSCIALIHPAAVQDPFPKKKNKVGSGVAEEKMGVRRCDDDHEKRRWVCSV